jgi:hypothetical protein
MENIAIWGYLRYTKSSPNVRKVFKRIWRIREKNLCVHGEDAKRLLAYSPYTPRDIKVCISPKVSSSYFLHAHRPLAPPPPFKFFRLTNYVTDHDRDTYISVSMKHLSPISHFCVCRSPWWRGVTAASAATRGQVSNHRVS